MKNLLFKELRLCVSPQTLIFCLFGIFIMVPQWPSLVAFIYIFAGIFVIFPYAAANKDMEFTAILPIRKSDVVKGKVLLVGSLELFSTLFTIPFALIKKFLITPATGGEAYADLGINFALFGFVFLLYGIFNLVYFPWYYKNPAKTIMPQLVSMLSTIVLLCGIMIVFMAVPEASKLINDFSGTGLIVQLSILLGGILIFILASFLSYKWSSKRFEKVDL